MVSVVISCGLCNMQRHYVPREVIIDGTECAMVYRIA